MKATVDAYDGTVTLYEWDEEDPILQAWKEVFPDVVQPKEDIPDALMEHLRYPEDLFKAQRYQFQRYHETSASAWFEGSSRWEVPSDPQRDHPPAAAVPPLHRHRRRRDVVADVRLRAAAQGEQPRGLHGGQQRRDQLETTARSRCCELPNEPTGGPLQIANTFATNEDVSQALLPYTTGDADRGARQPADAADG